MKPTSDAANSITVSKNAAVAPSGLSCRTWREVNPPNSHRARVVNISREANERSARLPRKLNHNAVGLATGRNHGYVTFNPRFIRLPASEFSRIITSAIVHFDARKSLRCGSHCEHNEKSDHATPIG